MFPFSCPLTFGQRVGLAWGLTWPIVAIDVAWAILTHLILGVSSPGVELLPQIPGLFLVSPWLVRRMMRGPHEGFTLKTIREGAEARMNYTESFKVMWLLMWRSEVAALGLLLVMSYFLRFLSIQLSSLAPASPFLNAVGLTIVLNGAGLILLPLVMPGMFHKHYKGFRVAVVMPAAKAKAPVRK